MAAELKTAQELSELAAGRPVCLYRNLNLSRPGRPAVWSVALATRTGGKGKVIGHCSGLTLTDARAVVSSRAEKIRAAGSHREVVAWLTGTVAPFMAADGGRRLTFKLYETCQFHTVDDGAVFERGAVVRVDGSGCWVVV